MSSSDFSRNFRRPDAGVFTVEGNVAGNRAAMLAQQRQRQQEEFERQKAKLLAANSERSTARAITDRFAASKTTTTTTTADAIDKNASKDSAIQYTGQETISEQEDDVDNAKQLAQAAEEERVRQEKAAKKARKKALKEKRKMMSTLSFAGAEGEDEDNDIHEDGNDITENIFQNKKAKKSALLHKDPTVDTSFLPDKERDEQAQIERERLEKEWNELQEKIRKEQLEIVYSYWDGSGHRRSVVCLKGDTIFDFLEKVRKDLSKEFRELTSIAADALIYVKEDLIIPQDMTFYDLIVTKARGKSGPLFHFDVHEDIRIGAIDSRIEKDESHPGKVVERRWYERNKHIFPASRWEVFDPAKDYGGYTIGDTKKRKK